MIAYVTTELYTTASLEVVATCVKWLTDNGTLNARVFVGRVRRVVSLRGSQITRSRAATDIDGTDPRVRQSDNARELFRKPPTS